MAPWPCAGLRACPGRAPPGLSRWLGAPVVAQPSRSSRWVLVALTGGGAPPIPCWDGALLSRTPPPQLA
eukprot:71529-Lingulodinium_polyedra.AAC.1